MSNILECHSITREYGHFKALGGVSLVLEKGAQYAIQGASGSGKSTLLYLLGGLDRASSGKIIFEGKELGKMSDRTLARYRNRVVGFVFQFHFLLPSMSCEDNIMLPVRLAGLKPADYQARMVQLAERLGVKKCLVNYPYQLSGGEQQRINLIRAVLLRPALLLCDEPTGNLDSENSKLVTELLHELSAESESTLVVVTHDLSVAKSFQNQIFLKDGKVITRQSDQISL